MGSEMCIRDRGHRDIDLRAQALIGLGNARHTDSRHHGQQDWYLEALGLLAEKGDINLRVQALTGLANASGAKRDNPAALEYINQALVLKPQDRGLLDMKSKFTRFIEKDKQSSKSQTQYGGQGKGSGKGSGMRVHSFFRGKGESRGKGYGKGESQGKGSGKGPVFSGDGGSHKRERDGDGYRDARGQGSSKR